MAGFCSLSSLRTQVRNWDWGITQILEKDYRGNETALFPQGRQRRIYSNSLLERVTREIKRRTNMVGVLPDRHAVIRLVVTLRIVLDVERQIGRRYLSLISMKALLEPGDETKLAALRILAALVLQNIRLKKGTQIAPLAKH